MYKLKIGSISIDYEYLVGNKTKYQEDTPINNFGANIFIYHDDKIITNFMIDNAESFIEQLNILNNIVQLSQRLKHD